MAVYALYGVAALLVLTPIAVVLAASPRASNIIYGACLVVTMLLGVIGLVCLFGRTVSIPRHYRSVCPDSVHISV